MKTEVKQAIIYAFISGLLFISLVITLMSAYEYYVVGIQKDVAGYNFGNEHSMEDGSNRHESATSYSQSMLFETTIFFIITLFLCLGIAKKRLSFIITSAVILVTAFFLLGCSEQKTDDPIQSYELWSGQKPDPTVNVLNGQYWQSAHWSKEYILYLEIQPSATWRKAFLKQNNLTLGGDRDYPTEAPVWFKPSDNYRVWKSSTSDQDSRYFEDTLSGHMYLYEVQL